MAIGGLYSTPMSDSPINSPRDPLENVPASTLGMWLFLISLAALFIAMMIGYLIVMGNLSSPTNPANLDPTTGQPLPERLSPLNLPTLPTLLWMSTVIILVSSATLQYALNSVRKDNQSGLRTGLVITFILGLVFLILQAICWLQWHDKTQAIFDDKLYRFAAVGFYVMSGVHALHLIGGLAPMAFTIFRAFNGKKPTQAKSGGKGAGGTNIGGTGVPFVKKATAYTAESHGGIKNLTLYWHFLDIIWLIMFAGMLLF